MQGLHAAVPGRTDAVTPQEEGVCNGIAGDCVSLLPTRRPWPKSASLNRYAVTLQVLAVLV
jgi:hypothetical protein